MNHERLRVYEVLLRAAKRVPGLVAKMPRGFSDLEDQLKRAMASAILNLAEGNGRTSIKERSRFFDISLASISESAAIADTMHAYDLISAESLNLWLYSVPLSSVCIQQLVDFIEVFHYSRRMQERLVNLVLFYPLFLFSLSFHEAAHALVADKFGDSTARLMGRISLSPFPHIDLIGTVALPIFGILTGAPVIGWGKPVPVNPYQLKGDMRRSSLWVAAAGPASNIALAFIFAGLTHLLIITLPSLPASLVMRGSFSAVAIGAIFNICEMGVILNLVLAFFNLLPLPPLDGGSVLRGILPESTLQVFDNFSRYGFVILLALFVTGMLRYILIPVFLLANYLLPA